MKLVTSSQASKPKMIKCQTCRVKDNQFVHDLQTDSWICTICGTVATHYWNPDKRNVNFQEQQPDVIDSFQDKKTKNAYYQLMVRAFPKEERDRKRKKMINNICTKVDAPSTVKCKATILYDNNKEELSKIKPIKKMLIACVVVASRASTGVFVPMSSFKNMFLEEASDINVYTKKVCEVIGMNQRTFSLAGVPYVTSYLRFGVKYEKKLIENYEKVGLIAPSTASETRLAIAACKLLKDNNRDIDYEYVAYLTDTTETAIKTFFDKNIKKRKREDTKSLSNSKKSKS